MRTSTSSTREAQSRAIGWLLARQHADGSFLHGDRTFEVWDTLIVLNAFRARDISASVMQRAWNFVHEHVRADGIAYHHRNRGTALACTETTGLMNLVHELASLETPLEIPLPGDAFTQLLIDNTDAEGRVRVNSDHRIMPEPLQVYPSVGGFALMFSHRFPEYRNPRHPVVERVKRRLRHPATIQRPWQYFATEYYALYYMLWGLWWSGTLDDADIAPVVAYVQKNQTREGAIGNGIRTPTTTSIELHTGLALNAVAMRSHEHGPDILDAGVGYLISRQRADGSVHGGIFARRKQEDIYATALLVTAIDALYGQ